MPTCARQASATELFSSGDAAELFDLDEVGEGVLRVDERVDLLETLSRVLEQVDLLPAPGVAQPALAVAQPLHAAACFVEQARRQRAEFLEGQAVGVDGAFEAQERQDLGARRPVAGRQAMVVQQHPDGEHDVEVGIVREDVPLALAQIEAAQQQHHGLLAGRQREGAHAALVVIEVVDAAHRVREGLALRGAVQEDRAGRRVTRLRRAHAAAALDAHREGGRLYTDEPASARVLADLVALRGAQRAHRRARALLRLPAPRAAPGPARPARETTPRTTESIPMRRSPPRAAPRSARDPRAASSRRPGPAVTLVTGGGEALLAVSVPFVSKFVGDAFAVAVASTARVRPDDSPRPGALTASPRSSAPRPTWPPRHASRGAHGTMPGRLRVARSGTARAGERESAWCRALPLPRRFRARGRAT